MSKAKKISAVLAVALCAVAALGLGRFAAMLREHKTTPIIWWDSVKNPRKRFPGMDRVNVLLIGKDYNRDSKGMPYTKGARSDTLIMLSLDLDRQKVSALSIPRDTYVEFPDTERRGKINGAYARGGAPLAMQTVGNLLAVPPEYHIALKPDAVKRIVDLLGGVEVETIDRMKYDDNWGQLHIDLPKGRQTINGDQAVGFTRFRKSNPGEPRSKEEGDERRMARQQMLLRAILQKAKSPGMFTRAPELMSAAWDSIETDLTFDQVTALAVLFKGVQPEQMQTASLTGDNVMIGGLSYYRPDPDKMAAQVDWLLRGDESAAYRLTVVTVKNGSGVRGAARHVADLLREQGFDAKSAGNVPRDTEVTSTQIQYGQAAVVPRAEHIQSVLRGGTLVKQPREDLGGADVSIVLGKDVAASFAERSAKL